MRRIKAQGRAALCVAVGVLLVTASPAMAKPIISSVAFEGNEASPTVIITGKHFGKEASHYEGGAQGSQFFDEGLRFQDRTHNWEAGNTNDIGLAVKVWTSKMIVFAFGDFYRTEPNWTLTPGDLYLVVVKKIHFEGTVTY
jgi:hypothetical protein